MKNVPQHVGMKKKELSVQNSVFLSVPGDRVIFRWKILKNQFQWNDVHHISMDVTRVPFEMMENLWHVQRCIVWKSELQNVCKLSNLQKMI